MKRLGSNMRDARSDCVQPAVFFFHVPKTAGTAFRSALEAFYDHKQVLQLWNEWELLNMPPWRLPGFRFIASHCSRATADTIPLGDYSRITFVREPIARSISHFYHIRRTPEASLHQLANHCSLSEFVMRSEGVNELANFQTRTLGAADVAAAGDAEDIADQPWGDWVSGAKVQAALRRATRFLEECSVVGVVERMRDSMSACAALLGVSSELCLGTSNQSPQPAPRLSAETRSRLVEINEWDLRLYAEAERLLTARACSCSASQLDSAYAARMALLPRLSHWRFTPAQASFSYGWHGREKIDNGEWARWTAREKAIVDVPLERNVTYDVRFRAGCYTLQQLATLQFTVNGHPIALRNVECASSKTQRVFAGTIGAQFINTSDSYTRLAWEIGELITPISVSGERDTRAVGIYLWWCDIKPAQSFTGKVGGCA